MLPRSVIEALSKGPVEPEPPGSLICFSVHRGDMKFSFDSADPYELERAKLAVQDMLKKGYMLFVQDEAGELYRVREFDPAKCEYIVRIDKRRLKDEAGEKAAAKPEKRIPAKQGRARAVAPTAGG